MKKTDPLKSKFVKSSQTSVDHDTPAKTAPPEDGLQWSEKKYRFLIESISDGIAVLDRQWKYILVNSALPPMIGKSRDELLGSRIMDVFPGVEESVFFKTFRNVLKTGKPAVVNDSYTFQDGSEGWFEVHVYPVYEGICIIVSDITERKRVEALLLEKDRTFNRLQEIAHIGSWELDIVNNTLSWSDEVYRIFGLRPQEFGASYEAFLDAVHPDDRSKVDAAYSSSLKEGRDTYEIEHRIVRKSTGEIRYVHEKCEHKRDSSGRTIRSEGMVHDITDRKKAEKQIVSLSKFPSENPNPVLRIDGKMNIQYWNQAVNLLLKKNNMFEKDIFGILPSNLDQIIQKALDTGNPVYDLEVNAGDRVFSYSISPVAENQYVNVYAIDVTERKNAELELQKHREHLEELVKARTKELKDTYKQLSQEVTEKLNYQAEALRSAQLASIGELAAGVAHEINNPINGIINGAQILVNKIPPESKEHQIAGMVLKEGDRIASIVGNLLSFARESKLPKASVNILEIMNDTLALTEAQIRKEMIRLKVKIPADLPNVYAQPQQMQQVFLNIINNARYAMNKKYPSAHKHKVLSISGDCVTVDDTLYVRVVFFDNGVGIPYENLGKVINPFFTTKPPKEGTGLGLSISHGIVEDHSGALVLDSVAGEFTKVTIDLPVHIGA